MPEHRLHRTRQGYRSLVTAETVLPPQTAGDFMNMLALFSFEAGLDEVDAHNLALTYLEGLLPDDTILDTTVTTDGPTEGT